MSSSQGGNTGVLVGNVDPSIPPGYTFSTNSIRDSSDWIRQVRERRKFANYKSASTDNKQTEPVWLKYGNQFRLSYLYGKLKCTTCNGVAFVGSNAVVGGS
jgi:hypothetical protein